MRQRPTRHPRDTWVAGLCKDVHREGDAPLSLGQTQIDERERYAHRMRAARTQSSCSTHGNHRHTSLVTLRRDKGVLSGP